VLEEFVMVHDPIHGETQLGLKHPKQRWSGQKLYDAFNEWLAENAIFAPIAFVIFGIILAASL
jgi:hypothetical protein